MCDTVTTQDPPTTPGGRVSVHCYVRTDAVSEPVESTLESVRALERSGAVDEYEVRTWPAEVVLTPVTEATLPVERYRTFRKWAAQWGVRIEPPFRRTTERSAITDETRDVLRTPAVCLAVHVDGRLREVFPHTSKGTTYSVADAVETLAGGVLTVDDSVDADPADPRHCPRCDVTLETGQGLYACPDCEWVGVATADGAVRRYDDIEPDAVEPDDAEPSMLRR